MPQSSSRRLVYWTNERARSCTTIYMGLRAIQLAAAKLSTARSDEALRGTISGKWH